jgi:hypothetical protein
MTIIAASKKTTGAMVTRLAVRSPADDEMVAG